MRADRQTDRQTDTQTYRHADCNILHPQWSELGEVINERAAKISLYSKSTLQSMSVTDAMQERNLPATHTHTHTHIHTDRQLWSTPSTCSVDEMFNHKTELQSTSIVLLLSTSVFVFRFSSLFFLFYFRNHATD